jgi:SHS2 domain-containing protein
MKNLKLSDDQWSFAPHTADLRLLVKGVNPEQLFFNAAAAMTGAIYPDTDDAADAEFEIAVQAENPEDLLVDWLRELLFIIETREFVPTALRFDSFSENSLTATVAGHCRSQEESPEIEIKGVTYHGLSLKHGEGGFEAQMVFDI